MNGRKSLYELMSQFVKKQSQNKRRNAWFLFGLLTPRQRTAFINTFIIVSDEE